MNKINSKEKKIECHLCNDTKSLTQLGIVQIYLLPLKLPIILIFSGIIGALFFSQYMLLLTCMGLMYPLAMADLRMYIYPIASIAHLCGKQLNCPKCEPYCSVFRK